MRADTPAGPRERAELASGKEKPVNTGTLARWPGRHWWWILVPRICVLGLVLADVAIGHPAPGFSGQRLVLLIGTVLAATAWLGSAPVEQPGDRRVLVPLLAVGMAGGSLAGLVSPNSVAMALPAVTGIIAGSSLTAVEGIGIAACGLAILGVGSLVVHSPGFSLLGASLAVAGGLLAGLWRGQYRLRAEQAELAAAQTQRAEQEHIRVQVLDERARIAREIHDILAHTLGGLVVQLDAADALLGKGEDPEVGRRLVGGARHLAVEGLQEARQAIAALRTDPVDLPEALAALTAGDGRGRQVSYEVRGTPRRLAAETGLAVYRTAQEALANARKHAPGAPVSMTLSFKEQAAALRVANGPAPNGPAPNGPAPNGPAPNGTPPGGDQAAEPLAATGGGYGLNGLIERAELLGGTLRAGPDKDGWVVELEVPG